LKVIQVCQRHRGHRLSSQKIGIRSAPSLHKKVFPKPDKMKTSQKLIVLAAFIGICVLPSVLSLKCYICNNLKDGKSCGHGKDVDPALIKDCNTQSDDGHEGHVEWKFCRKIVTWIDFDVNNNTATERVVRKCGHIDSKYNDNCYYRGGFGGRQQVCTCSEDGCNSGFTFRANHLMMGVAATILLVVARS